MGKAPAEEGAKECQCQEKTDSCGYREDEHHVRYCRCLSGQDLQVRFGHCYHGAYDDTCDDDDRKLRCPGQLRAYLSPMGIMAISTPRVKNPIPIIRKAAPARNSISGSRGMGVMVIPRINTMQVTGSTDDKDSVIFLLASDSINYLLLSVIYVNIYNLA